jgi:hypothetical protein
MISMINKLLKASFRRNTVRAVRIDVTMTRDLVIPIWAKWATEKDHNEKGTKNYIYNGSKVKIKP